MQVDRPLRALSFSLAASIFFAGMGVSVKALHGSVGTPEIVFFRGLAGAVVGVVLHLLARVPLRTDAPRVLLLRIVTGTLSLSCYYGAIGGAASEGQGALATANLLLKTAPVWVALGAGFLLGERAGARVWLALGVGVAGAAIALANPAEGTGGRGTALLGLLSGVFAAGAYLSVRSLATREQPLTIVTLFSLGVAVLMGPVVVFRWKALPDAHGWALVGSVAACGTTAQYLMTHAYRHGQAAIVAVSGLSEVAFTVAAAMIFFDERPSAWTFVGGGLAVLAGLVATAPLRVSPRAS